MPFTPYHFGPSAIIGLPLRKHIDIPVFVLANVVVDIEPLAVILLSLNYPAHGIFHTFLIGGLAGAAGAALFYPVRNIFRWLMGLFGLPYQTSIRKMMLSGALGVWLHVILDGLLYAEMTPFWPIRRNYLHGMMSYSTVFILCEASCIAAAVIYSANGYFAYRNGKKLQANQNS